MLQREALDSLELVTYSQNLCKALLLLWKLELESSKGVGADPSLIALAYQPVPEGCSNRINGEAVDDAKHLELGE